RTRSISVQLVDSDRPAIECDIVAGGADPKWPELGSLRCGSRSGNVYPSLVRVRADCARSLCGWHRRKNQLERTPIAKGGDWLCVCDLGWLDCICALGRRYDRQTFRSATVMVACKCFPFGSGSTVVLQFWFRFFGHRRLSVRCRQP